MTEENQVEIIPAPSVLQETTLAHLLRTHSERFIETTDADDPVSRKEHLTKMLWDLVVTGRATYSDGVELRVAGVDRWMSIVKWVTERMEGTAPQRIQVDKRQTEIKIDLSQFSIEELRTLRSLSSQIRGEE